MVVCLKNTNTHHSSPPFLPLTWSLTVMGICRESTETDWLHHHAACGGTSASLKPSLTIHRSSTNLELGTAERTNYKCHVCSPETLLKAVY